MQSYTTCSLAAKCHLFLEKAKNEKQTAEVTMLQFHCHVVDATDNADEAIQSLPCQQLSKLLGLSLCKVVQ